MDFEFLIGLDENTAKNKLIKSGYNNINVIINDKPNDKCNMSIVCKVIVAEQNITLVCSRFYVF